MSSEGFGSESNVIASIIFAAEEKENEKDSPMIAYLSLCVGFVLAIIDFVDAFKNTGVVVLNCSLVIFLI